VLGAILVATLLAGAATWAASGMLTGPASAGVGGTVWAWSNGIDIPGDDTTVPNSDSTGNPADGDDDNDGRLDADETAGVGCGGVVTEVSLDNGYSDGDGTSWDTDGDMVPDGLECVLGTDPAVSAAAHRTTCFTSMADGDTDGDGVSNDAELCKWGTLVGAADSDGDGMGDCVEVHDVNGSGFVTNADAILINRAFLVFPGDLAAMDVTGNHVITLADIVLVRQKFLFLLFGAPFGPCA
jgi:hypothetical protein